MKHIYIYIYISGLIVFGRLFFGGFSVDCFVLVGDGGVHMGLSLFEATPLSIVGLTKTEHHIAILYQGHLPSMWLCRWR